jgi:hypothetical protein
MGMDALPPSSTTKITMMIMATVAPVLRFMEPSDEPEAPAAFCPAWFVGSEATFPGCTPYVPPLGLLDAMAENTLYEDDAVAEGDPEDVEVCAIELGRGWGDGKDQQVATESRNDELGLWTADERKEMGSNLMRLMVLVQMLSISGLSVFQTILLSSKGTEQTQARDGNTDGVKRVEGHSYDCNLAA